MELVAIAVVALCALVPLCLMARTAGRAALVIAAAAALVVLAALSLWPRPTGAYADNDLPAESEEDGYVSAKACQSCHPSEYASWYETYHRTMTQVVSPQTVLADFGEGAPDGVDLESRGISYHLERVGDEFWVDMVDPDWEMSYIRKNKDPRDEPNPPRKRKRIVMSTGSHSQQTYWVPLESDRSLFQLPWTWLIAEGRWVPREDAFLHPPDDTSRTLAVWNTSCIKCHSVGGKPELVPNTNLLHTTVGDFGISCEACHGPGGEHIAANRDPRRRYQLHLTPGGDPTIVNPENLDHVKSSMVCGQCHSFHNSRDQSGWWEDGLKYRPGDDLELTRELGGATKGQKLSIEQFYRDGTYRVGGREFTGMMKSGCYTRGEMSCLSCHSMHKSDPDDQLKEGMRGDVACTQCHDAFGTDATLTAHTRHPPESEGSRCYNCHMPYTAYALFKGIRSHQIDSPSVRMTLRGERPNACNLCHLDKTIAWTAEKMTEWYGHPGIHTTEQQKQVAAAVETVLTGNSAERVLMAWVLGWESAQEASGDAWIGRYLSQLLQDPYAAVRQVSYNSIRTLPGFEEFAYDYLAPEDERREAHDRALAIWRASQKRSELDPGGGMMVLPPPEVALPEEIYQALLARRDNQPIRIQE